MIITQGLDSNIIPAHGRSVIIVDECNGPLEITAVISGLSNTFSFIRQPFDGRVSFDIGPIAKQVYRKIVDYKDPFDYSATTVYGTSDPYHFGTLAITLFDGTSQINLSYRVLNASIQLGDDNLDSYVGSVLSFLDCDAYTPPANLDPIAFNDSFMGEMGSVVVGNLLIANPENLDYDPDGDPLTVASFVVGGTSYAAGATVVTPSVGSLQVLSDGSMTFTSSSIYTGTFTFNYNITDGNGGSDNAQVYITMTEIGIYENQYQNQYE